MTRLAILAAAAVGAALLGWRWRRYCAWWKNHDRLGYLAPLAVVLAAASAAGLRSLAWVDGYRARATGNPLTDYAQRWWLAKADGHRLAYHLDSTAAAVAAGACLAVAALAAMVSSSPGGAPKAGRAKTDWHAPERITEALVTAKVLAPGKDGLAPRVTYRGKVQRDAYGEQLHLTLPPGRTLDDVTRNRAALASALGVPLERLAVEQAVDAPANAVTLWVGKPRDGAAIGSGRRAAVADAARTCWADGAVFGIEPRGVDVTFRTIGLHTLVVGAPESGKTRTVRVILLHALLDLAVKVRIINGKGDAADWEAAAPACADYVGQIDDDMPPAVERILNAVLAESRAVAAASRRDGRAVVGNVLVVEEWAAIRTHVLTVLGAPGLERVDKLMATVLATTRSAGTHVILISQRPTADGLPTSQSANVVQRLVHRTTKAGDTAIALGEQPSNPRPRRRGQLLILDAESGERVAFVDDLPDADWEAGCARAAELRGVEARPAMADVVDEEADVDEPDVDDEPVVDPLLAAVVEALEHPGKLTPTELFEALPDELRPTSAATLGKRLAARGLASQMVDKRRVYTREAAVAAAVVVPSP